MIAPTMKTRNDEAAEHLGNLGILLDRLHRMIQRGAVYFRLQVGAVADEIPLAAQVNSPGKLFNGEIVPEGPR
jgi:hypothetical protein